jgi:ABC-type spermidine/putrescine transport system permease subunit I
VLADARPHPGRRGGPRALAGPSPALRRRPGGSWALFVGPYGLYLLVFLALPFLNVALLSVYQHSPTKIAVAHLTGANYAKLWEPYYASLFLRTLRLAVIVTALCAALGYPLAYVLARSRPRAMTLGLFLLIMPLMVSTVIRVFGWVVILGNEGLVNQALRLLGAREGLRILNTEVAVVIGLAQQSMPFMVLPVMAAIERISPSIEEAARNLGASWIQMFGRTILPLSIPGLVSGALLVFSASMSAFVTPALMGGRRARMVGQQIFEEVLSAYDWPGAASLTIMLSVLMLALVGLALLATRRRARLEAAAR